MEMILMNISKVLSYRFFIAVIVNKVAFTQIWLQQSRWLTLLRLKWTYQVGLIKNEKMYQAELSGGIAIWKQ